MTETILKGSGVSAGVAMGTAFRYQPLILSLPEREAASADAEWARFEDAQQKADAELAALYERLAESIGEEHAEIFQAHRLLLADPMLQENIQERVNAGAIIEAAVNEAATEIAGMFREMDDELIAARAADIEDIGRRLLRILLNVADTSLSAVDTPSVIIAEDLSPSETASLNPQMALGICLVSGGATSHAAILARSLGLPAVVGAGDGLAGLNNGDIIALDGSSGDVVLHPGEATAAAFEERRARYQRHVEITREYAPRKAQTADNHPINVYGNIGDAESAKQAVSDGAEGVGLLRTEFMYLDRSTPPDEAAQIKMFRAIFEAMGERPVVVRTMDIGGDKPPTFLDFPQEMNPFLGWRGIRVSLDEPELFKTQIRAVLQAAVGHPVQIMYPMIESLETMQRANGIVADVRAELSASGLPYNEDIPLGMMVETPAAAVMLDIYMDDCDFFSIGTNDLVQYTLAVDRGNQHIRDYYDGFNPAVLRLIQQVIQTGNAAGKSVSVCGEMAGDKLAIPLLLGMGLKTFSMTSSLIPQAKWLLSQFTQAEAQSLAEQVMGLSTAEACRGVMRDALRGMSDE